jgi:hypothetical protein
MRNSSKLLLATVTATALLSIAVSAASARRIEVSEQRIYAIWSALELKAGILRPITCPVTLLGSFHSRTISKVSGQLVGFINHATVNSERCVDGRARILTETLPWHVRYDSFAGTLPTITRIRLQLINASFLVEAFGFATCLYRTEAVRPALGDAETGGTEEVNALTPTNARISSQTAGCPVAEFAGSGNVRARSESETTKIRVRLVQ